MDKINTQKFNLGVNKSDTSKADDVLGSLFSIPVVFDEKKTNGKIIHEFIVNPSIEKILSSKKSSNILGKLEIMYKDLFSNIPKNQSIDTVFKNDDVFDFNSRKIPNILSLNVKSEKFLRIKNIKKEDLSKLATNELSKDLGIKMAFLL